MAWWCCGCIPLNVIVGFTFLYVGLAAASEYWLPHCWDVITNLLDQWNAYDNSDWDEEDPTCSTTVDNSTGTILSGLVVSAVMFFLTIDLLVVKYCYSDGPCSLVCDCCGEDDYDHEPTGSLASQMDGDDDSSMDGGSRRRRSRHRQDHAPVNAPLYSRIRPSGIKAQFLMGMGVLLQTAARMLQPDTEMGNSVYWSLVGCSYVSWSSSLYCHSYLARRSLQQEKKKRWWCDCSALWDDTPSLGGVTALALTTSLLLFAASVACAILSPDDVATSDESENPTTAASTVDNVFDPSARWLQQDDDAETTSNRMQFDHVCQKIVYYGDFGFQFLSFFFWYATSKVLQQAVEKRSENDENATKKKEQAQQNHDEEEEEDEEMEVWGLSTYTATSLLPWVSFLAAHLYPVWIWLAADFTKRHWLDISELVYGGMVQHFGLLIISLLAHNWTRTLTTRPMITEIEVETATVFTEDVFHDLTLGVFEQRKKREAVFHDLTLGALEPARRKSFGSQEMSM